MCCQVARCCCCVRLRAGVIVIACLWLLGDSLFLAWRSYVTYALNKAMQELDASYWDVSPEDRDAIIRVVIIQRGVFWMAVVVDVLHCVAVPLDIALLVGAIKARSKLLHGWLVGYAVVYVLFFLLNGLNLALEFFYNAVLALMVTAGFLVHAGLTLYFWVVVRSYYLQLRQQNGEVSPRSTAGKVYRTAPMGGVIPAQGNHHDAGAMAMGPTAPPPYTASPYRTPHGDQSIGIMR